MCKNCQTRSKIYAFILFEFSLNVLIEFSDKKNYILKRLFNAAVTCVRELDATTAAAMQGYTHIHTHNL